jgi:HAE1 family hydrophobic/amphiphilic exporter-1
VFVPLIFMSENPQVRIMFGELGKPLCIALIASLLAAMVFLPTQVVGSLGPRWPWMETVARRLHPIGAIPARGLGYVFAFVARIWSLLMRAAAAVERVLLAILSPLRWAIALAAVGLAAWAIVDMLPPLRALAASAPFPLGPSVSAESLVVRMVLVGLAALVAAVVAVVGLKLGRQMLVTDAHAAAPEPEAPRGASIVAAVIEGNRRLVTWSLEHRLAATVVAVVALLTIVIPAGNMKVAAFGQDDNRSRVNLWVELEENFTIDQAETEMMRYEAFLDAKRGEYGFQRLADRFGTTGGRISLYWEKPQAREKIEGIQKELQKTLPHFAGHQLKFVDDEGGDRQNRSIVTFRLKGPDSEELARLGAEAVRILEDVRGLASLRSPLVNAPPLVRVKLDAALAERMGVNARTALENVSWALRGAQLPSYQEPGREVPLLIEYDKTETAGLSTLRDLDVYSGQSSVPLSSFSNLEFGRMSRQIERHNGEATFTITARIDDASRQTEIARAGRLALSALDLPRGYSIDDEDLASTRQEDELKEIWSALALSVVLVFLLMGILFESFLVPVSVLFTIPFAVLGSYWTLYLTNTAMDSVGWIGIIILVGVVANHGIVLIDRVYQLRRQGLERSQAVVTGCGNRVRPVLMTSLASVMALLPLALTEPSGEGIDYRALAICVAGGISMSTIFTLWVVPLAYTLLDDLSSIVAREVRRALSMFGPRKSRARETPPAEAQRGSSPSAS